MKQDDTLIKVAICEDDTADQQMLTSLLADYFNHYALSFTVSVFPSSKDLLRVLPARNFSLLFLDIFLDKTNGMELARHIRSLGFDVPIIFTTMSRDFAVESYEVNALYYIVKPVTGEKLAAAMKKTVENLTARQHCLEVVSGRETLRVCFQDILYAEAFGNQIILHTLQGDLPTYQSLNTLLKQSGDSFLRCHRSFLVNMDYIKKVDKKDFVLTSGDRVPIRTNGRAQAIEQYNRYFTNRLRGAK